MNEKEYKYLGFHNYITTDSLRTNIEELVNKVRKTIPYKKTVKPTHFNCDNCDFVYKIQYKNGFMCSGLVKEKHRADAYRICLKREGRERVSLDLKKKEVNDIIDLLENLLIKGE